MKNKSLILIVIILASTLNQEIARAFNRNSTKINAQINNLPENRNSEFMNFDQKIQDFKNIIEKNQKELLKNIELLKKIKKSIINIQNKNYAKDIEKTLIEPLEKKEQESTKKINILEYQIKEYKERISDIETLKSETKRLNNLDKNKKQDSLNLFEDAVKQRNLKLLKQLIIKNENINLINKPESITLLNNAISSLKENRENKILLEIIKMLISYTKNLNIKDNNAQTPFHKVAIITNNLPDEEIVELVNLLTKKGADSLLKDKNNNSPKDLANPESKIIEFLRIEPTTKERRTSKNLINNINIYELELIKQLKNSEIKTEQKFNRIKFLGNNQINREDPILCLAIESGKKDLFRTLMEENVAINIKNAEGETPLHCAAKFYEKNNSEEAGKRIYMIKALIDRGADINEKDDTGNRPVDLQIQNQDSIIYEYLQKITEKSLLDVINQYKIKQNLNNNLNNEDKKALSEILFYASWHGNIKILEELIKINLDMNTKNHSNQTPLHILLSCKKYAKDFKQAQEKYNNAIELLIKKGKADPYIKDVNNKTAVDIVEITNGKKSQLYKLITKNGLKNYLSDIK